MEQEQKIVDLNADAGESFGAYAIGQDEELFPLVSSASIACGFHAGDPAVMHRTVRLALRFGVSVGAHPGLPDLQGFGRREISLTPAEVRDLVLYQVSALHGFLQAEGGHLVHLKPHGALYNMAARDPALAEAIVQAVECLDPEIIILALPNSELIRVARLRGLRAAQEAFPDRAYMASGRLLPRSQAEASIIEPGIVARRAVQMVKERKTRASTGEEVPILCQSLCLHSDNPGILQIAKSVRQALKEVSVQVRPLSEIILPSNER